MGWIKIVLFLTLFFTPILLENVDLKFCVLSEAEMAKCQAMAEATLGDQENNDNSFGSYFHRIKCTMPYFSPEECMRDMAREDPTTPNVIVVDAGDVFVGGRYHSLVPILREVYLEDKDYYHAVAVIKKGSLPDVRTLEDLRGKHACFAGVGTQAGWTIPVYKLINDGIMPVVDCNNHVKSTAEFFGTSCAVNTLQDRYNPLGDNSNSLCEYCGSDEPGIRCTIKDPYSGFRGAIMCLKEKGDIAFVKHSTVQENGWDENEFELLCVDGSRAPLANFEACSWGVAPGHFVLVSSALDLSERRSIQRFLVRLVDKYRGVVTNKTIALGTITADDVEIRTKTNELAILNEVFEEIKDENEVGSNRVSLDDPSYSKDPSFSSFSVKNYKRYGNVPNLIFQVSFVILI